MKRGWQNYLLKYDSYTVKLICKVEVSTCLYLLYILSQIDNCF